MNRVIHFYETAWAKRDRLRDGGHHSGGPICGRKNKGIASTTDRSRVSCPGCLRAMQRAEQ